MRNFIAVVLVAVAALFAGQVMAADLPQYIPVVSPPPVDTGIGGSYYLRASVGLNTLWATNDNYFCGCGTVTNQITGAGYGYSFGAGFGYEVGNGLRADVTVDQINNTGLTDGTFTLDLRSTIALANAYYDFGLDGRGGSVGGGFGGYVGAGLGGAYNQTHVTGAGAGPDGANFAPAAALMAGVTYDMGNAVADLGYRMIYMPQIGNGDAAANNPFYVNQNVIHEIRGTLRYRLN